MERRRETRARIEVFANRYIDGHPYAVELVDASGTGLRIRTFIEPDIKGLESFPMELRIDGPDARVRLWAWTRRVWKNGCVEAVRIVSADPLERARFKKLLRARAAA